MGVPSRRWGCEPEVSLRSVPPPRMLFFLVFANMCMGFKRFGDHFQTLKFDPCVGFQRNMSLCCLRIDFAWVLKALVHSLCSVHGFFVKGFKTHAQDNEITTNLCLLMDLCCEWNGF